MSHDEFMRELSNAEPWMIPILTEAIDAMLANPNRPPTEIASEIIPKYGL